MKLLKKVLKITSIVFFILLIAFYILFYVGTAPKSDEYVFETFVELGVEPTINKEKFNEFEYRKVSIVRDTSLPNLVFIHGTIGSVLDFKKYMTDSVLMTQANMFVYDRIGYNYEDQNQVQESIQFEVEMLENMISDLNLSKTILVGYSYGGPIALASKKSYKKIILLAPAIYSEVEPMPWMLNLYKWKLTRWIIPPIWKEASKEKLSHREDLKNFESSWNDNPNKIISVHGDGDWIVPYSNSEYLVQVFPKYQLELITLPEANHDLIWSRFDQIRNLLIKELD